MPKAVAEILIPVRLSSEDFQEFALFDTMRLRKRWVRPAAFAAIFLASACACFALADSTNQGELLGWVLLAVGIGLPMVYFLYFFRSVKQQTQNMKLSSPRRAYTIHLDGEGVHCANATPPYATAFVPWEEVYGAWRMARIVYLYVSCDRAYLLPQGQASVSHDTLWNFLAEQMDPQKLHSKI